jgi:hypothetical protein
MTQYPQPGGPPGGNVPNYAPGGPVPNYLVQSIVSIICCWPLAIPAIIFATQVNGKLAAGDYAGAVDASKKAKMFSSIAIGLGLAWVALWIILTIAGVALPGLGKRG